MQYDKIISSFLNEDEIPGGKADGKSVEDIAKKHGVPVSQIKAQLRMGIKVEFEHTNDIDKATEISLDHLDECPTYYTRLKKMEKECEVDEMVSADVVGGSGLEGNIAAQDNVDYAGKDTRKPTILGAKKKRYRKCKDGKCKKEEIPIQRR